MRNIWLASAAAATVLVAAGATHAQTNLEKLSADDFDRKRDQFHEVISLFFYHLYRKFVGQTIHILLESGDNN